MGYFYDTYVRDALVNHNIFISASVEDNGLPRFEDVRSRIPAPFWENHQDAVDCYWKAWQLAFQNLKKPTSENGFVANYIGTCFNDCLFMWDSVFSLMYGKYAHRVFNFQRTLDNLYTKQHPDGFICREIAESDGTDRFHRFDPSSTGPNVMPWAEWEYYRLYGDRERIRQVLPVLAAYHRWLRSYRTWQDGAYWSSGWGCGMDNQPRLPAGCHNEFYHGHSAWVDICLQQIFSCKILLEMSQITGQESEMQDFVLELERLSAIVNRTMWSDAEHFYVDRLSDGTLSNVKSVGAYWALLADIIPQERMNAFLSHLSDPRAFRRHHLVPSLSADNPSYHPEGDYWRGGVWAMTNYMVLRGLTQAGFDALAHEIALNHHENVVKVFNETGTLWENYSPESTKPGNPAKGDFVGFGGIPPIAVLLEYVFGLRPDMACNTIVWDVRLLEAHGVNEYPFGRNGTLHLKCQARSSHEEKPVVEIKSNIPIKLELRWNAGRSKETFCLEGN